MAGVDKQAAEMWRGIIGRNVQVEWDRAQVDEDVDAPLATLIGVDVRNGWATLNDPKGKRMAVPLRLLQCMYEEGTEGSKCQ
jgi:hypothetical protein